MSFTLGVKDGDINFDVYGRSEFVEGEAKASQDLAEVILSTYDPGRDYGCRAVPGNVPYAAGKAFLSLELSMAVERLQSLQKADAASTADERISTIRSINISSPANDPTSFKYNVATETEAGSSVVAASTVKVRRMTFGHLS